MESKIFQQSRANPIFNQEKILGFGESQNLAKKNSLLTNNSDTPGTHGNLEGHQIVAFTSSDGSPINSKASSFNILSSSKLNDADDVTHDGKTKPLVALGRYRQDKDGVKELYVTETGEHIWAPSDRFDTDDEGDGTWKTINPKKTEILALEHCLLHYADRNGIIQKNLLQYQEELSDLEVPPEALQQLDRFREEFNNLVTKFPSFQLDGERTFYQSEKMGHFAQSLNQPDERTALRLVPLRITEAMGHMDEILQQPSSEEKFLHELKEDILAWGALQKSLAQINIQLQAGNLRLHQVRQLEREKKICNKIDNFLRNFIDDKTHHGQEFFTKLIPTSPSSLEQPQKEKNDFEWLLLKKNIQACITMYELSKSSISTPLELTRCYLTLLKSIENLRDNLQFFRTIPKEASDKAQFLLAKSPPPLRTVILGFERGALLYQKFIRNISRQNQIDIDHDDKETKTTLKAILNIASIFFDAIGESCNATPNEHYIKLLIQLSQLYQNADTAFSERKVEEALCLKNAANAINQAKVQSNIETSELFSIGSELYQAAATTYSQGKETEASYIEQAAQTLLDAYEDRDCHLILRNGDPRSHNLRNDKDVIFLGTSFIPKLTQAYKNKIHQLLRLADRADLIKKIQIGSFSTTSFWDRINSYFS